MTNATPQPLERDDRMSRPVLDFADTLYPGLRNKRVSECTPEESIVAGIAWMADNSEYGIDDAARELIDEFRAFVSLRSETAPIAWRWKIKGHTGDWIYASKRPDNLRAGMEWEVEPLFAQGGR